MRSAIKILIFPLRTCVVSAKRYSNQAFVFPLSIYNAGYSYIPISRCWPIFSFATCFFSPIILFLRSFCSFFLVRIVYAFAWTFLHPLVHRSSLESRPMHPVGCLSLVLLFLLAYYQLTHRLVTMSIHPLLHLNYPLSFCFPVSPSYVNLLAFLSVKSHLLLFL